MANIIDLFNAAILNPTKLTGTNNFFNTFGEITESSKAQERFLSNIDYSRPENFVKFGSAEEYYKSAITYIATNYPYDACKSEKLKWINNLNDFEYYLYKKEYPVHLGYIELSGSQQYIGAYSPSKEIPNTTTKNIYINGKKYFVEEGLNFDDGFTFESWIKFDNNESQPLLDINTVFSSSGGGVENIKFVTLTASLAENKFYISGTNGTSYFTSPLESGSWQHFAFSFNKNSSSFFKNGDLQEKIQTNVFADTGSNFVFYNIGIIPNYLTSSFGSTGSYSKIPSIFFGSGSTNSRKISFDETKFWNKERTIEKIGRNWFTPIDGNDFNDKNNADLLLYYKFNEGWSANSASYCLDYSGYQNNGYIFNYDLYNGRISGSAINSSSLVQDIEAGSPIYAPKLSSSADYLVPFYNLKTTIGADYDVENIHTLYNKFPSWMLEQEEGNEVKHLKQILQIVAVYFDDLYNKIGELSKYKHLNVTQDNQKIYPFYDKILTSTGFNVTDLFNNLSFIEKIASRTETNLFDEDILKIKNLIYQNIYNNLAYILKSKGTEKSIKSFLRSYGVGDNLVRVNLYPNGGEYLVSDNYLETIVKKKTITLTGSSNIYLSSSTDIPFINSFTLETAVIFPKKLGISAQQTASIIGFYVAESGSSDSNANKLQVYATVESGSEGFNFCFRTGSTNELVASSSYYNNLYDDSIWNISLGIEPNVDDTETLNSNFNYLLNFRAVNTYKENAVNFFTSSVSSELDNALFYDDTIKYFIGASNTNLTGSNNYSSNAKYLYCNFWTKTLSENEIINHNKDILNYGVE